MESSRLAGSSGCSDVSATPGPGLTVRRAAPADLSRCQAIRHAVFVVGQGVPEALELDGLDAHCAHYLVEDAQGQIVGTARLRELDGAGKVERVAVLESARGVGAGRALMDQLECDMRARGLGRVALSAQEAVVGFYAQLGYRPEGPTFIEAGIPHRKMSKSLSSG